MYENKREKEENKDYKNIVNAKKICEDILTNCNSMDDFIMNLSKRDFNEEILKYVFHVAACGTFIGKEGQFLMPTTKTCLSILRKVGFQSRLENIFIEEGSCKSRIFDYKMKEIIFV